jgi:hypothetical protein
MFALRWLFGHHFGRKDTTKNAHTQAFGQKNTFFWGRNVQVAEVVEIGEHSKWYRSGNGVTKFNQSKW